MNRCLTKATAEFGYAASQALREGLRVVHNVNGSRPLHVEQTSNTS
jgi:hypothetical protein